MPCQVQGLESIKDGDGGKQESNLQGGVESINNKTLCGRK